MKNKVINCLLSSKNVAIYSHINTDCDAMGSSLALREVLIQLGKHADIFICSGFPNNFKFYGDLSFVNKKTSEENYDLVVCLDTANENRLGKYKYSYRKKTKNTLLIDHHDASSEPFCKLNYVMHSSSTSELLYEIFCDMQIKFTKSICKNLLSGILTDTGKFTHSLSENTLKFAGELLNLSNIKIDEVSNPLFNSMTYEVFELMKEAYNRLELYADGKLSVIMFRHEDFVKTKTNLDQLDAFPDIALQLDSVKLAILASEDEQGYFRVSFRSKGNISSSSVASVFGGGGHLNASGCKIFGDFDEVKERLIQASLDTMKWKR